MRRKDGDQDFLFIVHTALREASVSFSFMIDYEMRKMKLLIMMSMSYEQSRFYKGHPKRLH